MVFIFLYWLSNIGSPRGCATINPNLSQKVLIIRCVFNTTTSTEGTITTTEVIYPTSQVATSRKPRKPFKIALKIMTTRHTPPDYENDHTSNYTNPNTTDVAPEESDESVIQYSCIIIPSSVLFGLGSLKVGWEFRRHNRLDGNFQWGIVPYRPGHGGAR